jgi:hypothetical protein
MAAFHILKTWPEPFAALVDGSKRHEVRVNDRNFQPVDTLELREWVPDPFMRDVGHFTGRKCIATVSHVTAGGSFGLPPNLCVMSLIAINRPAVEGAMVHECEYCDQLCASLRLIAEHPHLKDGEPTYGDPSRPYAPGEDLMRFFQLGSHVGHGCAAAIAREALKESTDR